MRISFLVLAYVMSTTNLTAQIIEEDNASSHAPDFIYTVPTGQDFQLYSHKGEVVYISFWASWCKPCIRNFEKYKEIRREMHDLGVTLLNISIDDSEYSWRSAMERLDIIGIHGKVNKRELLEPYQLYNVPRYEIVGREGEFLYLDRDDGKSVMDNFKEFLATAN